MSLPCQLSPTGLVVKVQAQPRASRNRLPGRHEQRLTIALAALIAFVAALLDVPPRTVSLRSGAKVGPNGCTFRPRHRPVPATDSRLSWSDLTTKSGMISVAHSCLIFERRTTRHADL